MTRSAVDRISGEVERWLKSGKHREMLDVERGKVETVYVGSGRHQEVTKADTGVRPTIRSDEFRSPPAHSFAHRQNVETGEQPGDVSAFFGTHAAGDLGNAHHASGDSTGLLSAADQPVPSRSDAAKMRYQNIAIDQDHARRIRSR